MSGWPGRDGRVQAAGREKNRWMEVVQSGMTEPATGTRSFDLCWRRPDRVDHSGKGHPVGRDGSRVTRTAEMDEPENRTRTGWTEAKASLDRGGQTGLGQAESPLTKF